MPFKNILRNMNASDLLIRTAAHLHISFPRDVEGNEAKLERYWASCIVECEDNDISWMNQLNCPTTVFIVLNGYGSIAQLTRDWGLPLLVFIYRTVVSNIRSFSLVKLVSM
jgi:hypothetical protein